VDALGYSSLTPQSIPRLLEFFKESGTLKQVRTLLGYSNTIMPSIFSGLYPDQHNVWGLFKMSPPSCPFKLVNLFPPLLFDKNDLIRYFAIQMIYSYSKKKLSIPRYMSPVNVPIRLLKYFDISLKKHIIDPNALEPSLTLFDLLRTNDIEFSYTGYPWDTGTEHILSKTKKAIRNSPVSVCYIDEIDHEEHVFGTSSNKFLERIKVFDDLFTDFLRKIMEEEKIMLLVFSDHGMRNVTETINIQSVLADTGLKLEKDFIFFLDSTIGRFWTFNEKSREVLREALAGTKGGRLLNNEEIKKYKINFKSNEYGDLIYLSDPGKLIMPNFYTVLGGTVKAMHGWDPLDKLQDSFLYVNRPTISDDPVDVTSYFHMMRTMIGV
jgi:hypothetical protein